MIRRYSAFVLVFFFFKQKTAYEMRISDWSSDVCSSDLQIAQPFALDPQHGLELVRGCGDIIVGIVEQRRGVGAAAYRIDRVEHAAGQVARGLEHQIDRKSTRLNSSH